MPEIESFNYRCRYILDINISNDSCSTAALQVWFLYQKLLETLENPIDYSSSSFSLENPEDQFNSIQYLTAIFDRLIKFDQVIRGIIDAKIDAEIDADLIYRPKTMENRKIYEQILYLCHSKL